MNKKLILQGERLPFIIDMVWPVAVLAAVLTLAVTLLLPPLLAMVILAGFLVGIIIYTLVALSRSKSEYSFLPASEYRGVRVTIHMGRMEIELSDLHREDFIFGASWVEKLMGVGHVKMRNTFYKMRAIRDLDEIKAWVEANVRSEADRTRARKKGGKK